MMTGTTGLQFEDKKEDKKGSNDGMQALYLNKDAHDAANELLDILKAKNKVIIGGKMTKKGIIEMAVMYFKDEVTKKLDVKAEAETAAVDNTATEPVAEEEEEKPVAKKSKK